MDPAGLLLNIATVLITIDQLQQNYDASSGTLSSIGTQTKILEASLSRVREWLHYTDPSSKAQVMHSLQDAIETVTGCIYRLQNDLDSTTRTGPKTSRFLGRTGSDQWVKTKFAFNEARLKRHLTDVRECVSLVHFTLSVCQLPVGKEADREVKELGLRAKDLSRAHTSRRKERKSIMSEQRSEHSQDHSAHLNAFVNSILDAENDLPEDSVYDSPPSRQSLWERGDFDPVRDHDELYLPGEQGDSFSAEPGASLRQPLEPTIQDTVDSFHSPSPSRPAAVQSINGGDRGIAAHQSGPMRPPKIPKPPSTENPVPFTRQVSRKPVKRFSVSAQSIMSDATLEPTPDTASGFQRSNDGRSFGASDTNMLFNQASRSLNSLADDFSTVNVQDNTESPPPYVNSPTNPPFRDIKRRDTQSTYGSIMEPTDIIQVVRENRTDLLVAMLERGVGIDEIDPITKRTAIMESAYLRRTKISQILIRCGSRLHLKDVDGNTALHFAASNGDADTCVRLLHAGAQLNEYNRNGEGPLDLAARGGHTETVICLLNSWNTHIGHATTLLKGFLEASKSGNASTAQAFIERGIKPNKLKESWKPMAFAAQSGSNPMVDLMLSEKCSLKDRSPDGWTALHFAAQAGHTAMVEKLLSWKLNWKASTKKTKETPLHLAVLAGHTSTALALILHKDANITMRDADDQQAIHHAVRNGDVQLTGALLIGGAKLDAHNKYGWSPLHIAAAYGHLSLIAEFVTRGVNLEEVLGHPSFDPGKKTNEAARKGYWCEIRWPHAAARPLHLALEFGHDDVAQTLIASGAKYEEMDSRGWKPLHYAAWNCRPQMVELLIGRGASPHVTTNEGNTPYSLGFREPGLTASYEDKERICGILYAAMNARKKSKMQVLTKIMSGSSNKTKDVRERNKAWHTAELAAALYQSGQLGESESESDLRHTPSISSQYNGDGYDHDDETTSAQPSSSRITKTMSDPSYA